MSRPYWSLDRLFSVLTEKRIAEIFRKGKEGVIDQTPDSPDMKRIASAGDRADDMVDAYIRGHYSVPLEIVPPEISEASVVLTVNNLLLLSESTALDEKYKELYKQTMKFLESVRDDKIVLAIKTGYPQGAPLQQGNGIVRYHSSRRMFGDETLAKF